MPVLLHIDSAIADEASRTRALTRTAAAAWRSRGADFTVVERDLHASPPPHLRQRSQHWPERLRDGAGLEAQTARLQDLLIAELLAADALLLGAPMYNYALPSTLKAWIDLVHVPGITSAFDTATEPLRGRPAVIVTAQGGSPDPRVDDLVVAPLRHLLQAGFGMDVHVVATRSTLAGKVAQIPQAEADAEFTRASAEAHRLGLELLG